MPTITTRTILFGKQFTGYDEKWWLMCQAAIGRSLFKPPGWRRGSENIDRASIDIVVSSKWIPSLPADFIAIFLKPHQKQLSCLHVLVVCFHWPWHWTGTLRCCLGGHWGAHTAWCWMQNGGAQTSARISPFWCTCRKKERERNGIMEVSEQKHTHRNLVMRPECTCSTCWHLEKENVPLFSKRWSWLHLSYFLSSNSGWELKPGLEWAGPGAYKTIVALCVEVELAFWELGRPHHC